MRCCNTCEDVREAYRLKGWAFVNADQIAPASVPSSELAQK
jgi:hypothetical protein